MDMIKRYIQAVHILLPSGHSQDILAELEEDIHSQVEDQQERVGRPLTDTELSALLKQRGNPLKVAASYGRQRYLIGPELFPAYWLVLRVAMAIWTGIWLLATVGMGAFSQLFQATHPALGLHPSALPLLDGLLQAAIWVTIGFIAIEQANAHYRFLDNWDPAKLPDLEPASDARNAVATRVGAAIELAMVALAIGWLVRATSWDMTWNWAGLHFALTPTWHPLFWAMIALSAYGIVLSMAKLLDPARTLAREVAYIIQDLGTIALFAAWTTAPILLEISGGGMTAEKAAEATRATNMGLQIGFQVTAVVLAVTTAIKIAKVIYRHWWRSSQIGRSAAQQLL